MKNESIRSETRLRALRGGLETNNNFTARDAKTTAEVAALGAQFLHSLDVILLIS